jgi:hypothetical protein
MSGPLPAFPRPLPPTGVANHEGSRRAAFPRPLPPTGTKRLPPLPPSPTAEPSQSPAPVPEKISTTSASTIAEKPSLMPDLPPPSMELPPPPSMELPPLPDAPIPPIPTFFPAPQEPALHEASAPSSPPTSSLPSPSSPGRSEQTPPTPAPAGLILPTISTLAAQTPSQERTTPETVLLFLLLACGGRKFLPDLCRWLSPGQTQKYLG